MFKKDVSAGAKTKLKSSAQRAVRAKIIETYPLLEPHIDAILPKKEQLDVMKLPEQRSTLYILPGSPATPLFWQHMDDALVPHLTLVHKYPDLWHRVRVDRGAIRFVLSGATLMVPGLTSPGGRLPQDEKDNDGFNYSGQPDLEAGTVVVVEAEGKQHACAVGQIKVSTAKMREEKKGVGMEGGHYVGDGLWKLEL